MGISSAKEVNQQIEAFEAKGEKAKVLEIGYKTYANLVADDKFADKLIESNQNTKQKYYKKIKIRLVTEKHYFEVKG
ncbi:MULTISPECIES: hypothetical protein [Acinetobacter]|uniref:Uncharacterized protein n=1 Tax=Acinetobacter ursingii TaxID=108980 RepID=A0A7T9UHU3_9GAMM|nr:MULTISPECIES: hypothetical protein [Acinetobacter]ENX48423.1 hypothetical protein F943_01955 [Acinetobacter ursingii NIPH 706]EXD37635.1 hypothetical protein J500_0092 [Acinetobacter sp. 479375]MCH2015702.1 hypothetical protein [Acinetobacter ursingii]MCU4521901.1 hypothetical protein [Acinetobacter ursingii]MCU4587162.1 hypothetical protein [Acinetobacter ursingii]